MMADQFENLMKFFLLAFIIPVVLYGCGKSSSERHYEEVVIDAPASNAPFMAMGEDPHAGLSLDIPIMNDLPLTNQNVKSGRFDIEQGKVIQQYTKEDGALTWSVPSGWQEEPGSGMRVVSFMLVDNPEAIDVSIVSLGGMAGGVGANLSRWAKQIELDVTSQDLDQLISRAPVVKTKAGAVATVFDFTKLQEGQPPSTKSTMAAMIELGEATVFVKMTGTIEAVLANKQAFEQLTQSVNRP